MIITPAISTRGTRDAQAAPAVKGVNPVAPHYRGEKLLKITRRSSINPKLVCLLSPKSPTAENYYRLRHAVEKLRQGRTGVVIGVTSPGRSDGKTTTAINLAGALAQDPGASVLLVDLDLRQPSATVRDYLDLKAGTGPGVLDWIQNPDLTPDQAGHYIADFNLYLMPSGGKADSPYEMLNSARLDEYLKQARQRYDYVILDTSHVLNLPDVQLLSKNVDGFLIVIKADQTPRKMLEETLDMMEEDKVIGLVFNGASTVG